MGSDTGSDADRHGSSVRQSSRASTPTSLYRYSAERKVRDAGGLF